MASLNEPRYIYQQIELTTEEWEQNITIYPESIWLFERLFNGKFNMKLSDGMRTFKELRSVFQDVRVDVKVNDEDTYILTVTTASGSGDTPNLRGTSAYRQWQQQPGNTNKTYEQFEVWLRRPATEAAVEVRGDMANISEGAALLKTNWSVFYEKAIVSEGSRVEAEKQRVIVENIRVASELLRISAEDIRKEAEGLRNETESERISAEIRRKEIENSRVLAEGLRVDEEKIRDAAELIRLESEAARVISEDKRKVDNRQAILDAEEATNNAKLATIISLDLNAHPMKIMGGVWFEWSVEDQEYKNTGIRAKGDTGASFRIVGRYDTLTELETAVPDGLMIDGTYAIGTIEPYSYYAWLFVDGVWKWDSQGKLRGEEGKTSYDVWTEKAGNKDKTENDYFNWLTPTIDSESGTWYIQGGDMGVRAKAIDAYVTEKINEIDDYVLHVESAAGEFDTPNLRGFDVKVIEDETNTPDNYKLKVTTVAGEFTTPNLKGRSGSSVIEIDHEPTEVDTHYTYNNVQYSFNVGDEVRWYDADNEAYVIFKCYNISASGAVWEELGSGISLPIDVFLNSPNNLSSDESDSYIFLTNGYLKGKDK